MQGELIAFGTGLILSCGRKLRKKRRDYAVEIREKNGYTDVVTNHDIWAQEYLQKEIRRRYPDHGFWGEEKTETNHPGTDGWCWVIDPIDGTANYAFLGRNYAISMALLYQGEIQYGWVYDAKTDRLYQGDGQKHGDPSVAADPKKTLLYMGYKTMEDLEKEAGAGTSFALCREFAGVRYEGCASLELCAIGSCQNRAYISSHLMFWDYAAAAAVLSAAGCLVMAAEVETGSGHAGDASIYQKKYLVCGCASLPVWTCMETYLPEEIRKKMKPVMGRA